MRNSTALALHELAHNIATGQRKIGIRWYMPEEGTRLFPVPVLPEAVHDALCASTAVNLEDQQQHVIVCDECKLAIEAAA
jgi:hypothetical protein